jgi:hypothetical protein
MDLQDDQKLFKGVIDERDKRDEWSRGWGYQ